MPPRRDIGLHGLNGVPGPPFLRKSKGDAATPLFASHGIRPRVRYQKVQVRGLYMPLSTARLVRDWQASASLPWIRRAVVG